MARLHRIDVPGVAQHVIVRGVDRQPCSFGDGDYETCLAMLRASAASSDCAVHAFVLMSNQRIAAHGALFRAALDPEDLTAIRLHANKSCTLGDARFQALIAAMVSRRAHVAPVGRPRRDAGKWT